MSWRLKRYLDCGAGGIVGLLTANGSQTFGQQMIVRPQATMYSGARSAWSQGWMYLGFTSAVRKSMFASQLMVAICVSSSKHEQRTLCCSRTGVEHSSRWLHAVSHTALKRQAKPSTEGQHRKHRKCEHVYERFLPSDFSNPSTNVISRPLCSGPNARMEEY